MATALAIKSSEIMLSSADTKELCVRILMFCENISQRTCYPYQKEFALRLIESIVTSDAEEITCLISRQAGKTEAVSIVVSGLLVILPELAQTIPMLEKFKGGFWVGIFAPTLGQGSTTYDRVRQKLKSKRGELIISDPEIDRKLWEEKGVLLSISNGSFVRMQSAAKQSKVESKTYHLIINEECQDMDDDKIVRQINPMGAAVGATQLKIGTPGTKVGEFYNAIQRNIIVKRGAKRNHFEYDYKICQKYNLYYKKYIAKEKIRLGEDSDAFRMAYKIEWLLERGMFCTVQMLEALYLKNMRLEYSCSKGSQVCGIDFGKQNDSTVLTILDMDESSRTEEGEVSTKLLAWLEMEGDDYEAQYPRMVDFISNFAVKVVCAGNTGVGAPIVDRLEKDLGMYMNVVGIDESLQKNSLMNSYTQKIILGERLFIPAHPSARKTLSWRKFVQQMTSCEKSYKGKYMVVHHPDLKDAHNDYCSSLNMALEATKSEVMPEIEVSNRDYFFK